MTTGGDEMIWGNLLHLSFNMWADWDLPRTAKNLHLAAQPELRFDDSLWNDLLQTMADGGMNMVVIDLGDGVKYRSHPEIAVENAWSVERLRAEITKMRAMGLEPIPKLNFSTCHDEWLGKYARMVSTPEYYQVCKDLIEEVIEIFDKPRFFHIGMDEEALTHQRQFEYVVIRQYGLWWRDLAFFTDIVERHGVRAWIWSDYVWENPGPFYEKMPTSILQSNWYYGASFDESLTPVKAYLEIDRAGFDQVPTLSNWTDMSNIVDTVLFSQKNLSPARLKGFLLAPWFPTLESARDVQMSAVEEMIKARKAYLAATVS